MQEKENEFLSLKEAAHYSHVCRQAVFVAIKKGHLKAEKRKIKGINQWIIKQSDLDSYRKGKYNRDKRIVDGEKLFDIANDRWSVLHASKTLSSILGRPYPLAHIYYLIRCGSLRAMKKGNSWVIKQEELVNLYYKETGEIRQKLAIS